MSDGCLTPAAFALCCVRMWCLGLLHLSVSIVLTVSHIPLSLLSFLPLPSLYLSCLFPCFLLVYLTFLLFCMFVQCYWAFIRSSHINDTPSFHYNKYRAQVERMCLKFCTENSQKCIVHLSVCLSFKYFFAWNQSLLCCDSSHSWLVDDALKLFVEDFFNLTWENKCTSGTKTAKKRADAVTL